MGRSHGEKSRADKLITERETNGKKERPKRAEGWAIDTQEIQRDEQEIGYRGKAETGILCRKVF
jgi:hypothetical protein